MSRYRRSLSLLTLVPLVAVGTVEACSSDEDGGAADASTDPAIDYVGPQKDGAKDDAAEAGPRPPPNVPSCLGESIPLLQSGERSYVNVSVGVIPTNDAGDAGDSGDAGDGGDAADAGSYLGKFLIDYGANGSTIDLHAFPAPGPAPFDCAGDPSKPGAQCSFTPFDFFGPWGTVSLYTADYSFLFNTVKQAGIIGTDFLAVYAFTLDTYGKHVFKATKASLCADAQLIAAGYVALPTDGFFTNDPRKLRPLSDVVTSPDAGVKNFSVPNVPTVPIRIAGANALAQLDTGYDDRIERHSINVNQALIDALLMPPSKVFRRADFDIYLTTCVGGLNQKALAYALTDDTSVDFLGIGGTVGRRDSGLVLYVKEKDPEADRCGGIDTWTVPAAQLGASFLVDAQAVVFDPFSSRVWIPKL